MPAFLLAARAWLATPMAKYVGIGVAILSLFLAGWMAYRSVYNSGAKVGKNEVINEVQKDAIEAVDKARVEKEKAREKATDTPYDDRVDKLR